MYVSDLHGRYIIIDQNIQAVFSHFFQSTIVPQRPQSRSSNVEDSSAVSVTVCFEVV